MSIFCVFNTFRVVLSKYRKTYRYEKNDIRYFDVYERCTRFCIEIRLLAELVSIPNLVSNWSIDTTWTTPDRRPTTMPSLDPEHKKLISGWTAKVDPVSIPNLVSNSSIDTTWTTPDPRWTTMPSLDPEVHKLTSGWTLKHRPPTPVRRLSPKKCSFLQRYIVGIHHFKTTLSLYIRGCIRSDVW